MTDWISLRVIQIRYGLVVQMVIQLLSSLCHAENMEVTKMPVDKVRGGYRVRSYVTGKMLKRVYKTRAAATRAASTSKRRSQRKRSTKSKRATRRRY